MIKKNASAPIILVGGLTDPDVMRQIVEDQHADYISLSRALIRDPKFPGRIESCKSKVSTCIHCNLCLYCLMKRPLKCHNGIWKKAQQ
ncbi:hypothetical protein KKA14_14405 [bacterium]|nr:hypothetical protein [bacterium]